MASSQPSRDDPQLPDPVEEEEAAAPSPGGQQPEVEAPPPAPVLAAATVASEPAGPPEPEGEVFVGDWSLPSTSRQGLRPAPEPPRRTKKDIKNEENLQRAACASSQAGPPGSGEGGAASTGRGRTRPPRAPGSGSAPGRHVCRVCSKAFGSPGKLSQHMYSHTGERPFQCTQCTKAFSSKFKLVRHVLIHSDERRYRCTVCERTFHRKDHLKNHVKVHSPVKKTFRCEREGCNKEYSSFLSFRKHVAVHAAEEGNLECKMCGKVFTTKEEIVYHLKVHAGSRTVKNPSDKKYRCDHCERRFFTRKDVRRHLVVHTGKRDFLCQFCPQRFGRKDHLVRHIKKSHHHGAGAPAAAAAAAAVALATRGHRPKRTRPARESEAGPSRRTAATRLPARIATPAPAPVPDAPGYASGAESGEESMLATFAEDTKDMLLLEAGVSVGSGVESAGLQQQHSPSGTDPGSAAATVAAAAAAAAALLKAEVTLPVERSSVTVHHRPQHQPPPPPPTQQELLAPTGLLFPPPGVPPPPYPASAPPFEPVPIKLEFPTPAAAGAAASGPVPGPSRLPIEGGLEYGHFLSLLPAASVEEAAGGGAGATTAGMQEELQRLLGVAEGDTDNPLLAGDGSLSSQLLHLIQSAASSLEMGPAAGASPAPAPSPNSGAMMHVMEAAASADVARQCQTPLPRFNQAFQQQQQQQQQPQQHPPPQQPPSQPPAPPPPP